jgi:hypothetical protein
MDARRIAGALIMALMVALLATVASAQSGSDAKRTLAGSWVVDVTPAPEEDDTPPFVLLRAFTKDGRMINSSPADGAAVGEWTKTGSSQFALTFMGFTKVGEDFLLLKVRESVEVNEGGDTFAGPYQMSVEEMS